MIYQQQSHLPIIFQVDENILLKINHFLKRNKLAFTNPLIITGQNHSKKYGKKLSELNDWETYLLHDNTFEDIELLKDYVLTHNHDLMIAVGGGKVIDVVKRVSYLININNLVVPTIISNDGLISPISIIRNQQGRTESIPGMMPMGVVIDIDIIRTSPVKYLRAAAGDILSNISATNDWVLAMRKGKARMNDIAFHLSRSAANSLIHFANGDLHDKQFLRLIIQGEVSSGIAMSLAGTSRPCSGSEHLISHALDYLRYTNQLHGSQVGSISLFTLFLQNKLTSTHLQFARRLGIPTDFSSKIVDFDETIFSHIVDKARIMRPGRYTILSKLENSDICRKLKEYKTKLLSHTQC